MSIFVYADESGVFDREHNDVFVFGGLIFLSREERDIARRRYQSAEKKMRKSGAANGHGEMKAIYLNNKQKSSMYRSMNPYHRFGVVVRQKQVNENIFANRKSKQRYLDYAFKRGVKSALEYLLFVGELSSDEVDNIYVYMDEHTTATDGRYELRESLETEFKIGTFNGTWNKFFPPLFPGMNTVEFQLRDSCQDALVRAADITANRLFYAARSGRYNLVNNSMVFLTLP